MNPILELIALWMLAGLIPAPIIFGVRHLTGWRAALIIVISVVFGPVMLMLYLISLLNRS